jgi:hypothetical protein
MPHNILLSEYKLEDIHQRILEKNATVKTTIQSLNVSVECLRRYLGKYNFNGKTLNYSTLHGMTQQMAANGIEHYSEIYNPPYNSLPAMTIKKIHKTILESKGVWDATCRLGIQDDHLSRYLCLLEWKSGELLSYTKLKSITAERAKNFWQDAYSNPLQNKLIVSIESKSIAAVHLAVHGANTLLEAAAQLKISSAELQNFIAELPYQGLYLTFESMKKVTIEEAKQYWDKDYDLDIKSGMNNLSYKQINIVHQTIIDSIDINDAAYKLGVGPQALKLFLNKIVYHNENLTYERMRNEITTTMALAYFGHNYYKAQREIHSGITHLSLEKIHTALRFTQHIAAAAQQLQIKLRVLQDYLARIKYGNTHLSCTELKKMTPAAAQEYWRQNYSAPLLSWNHDLLKKSKRTRQNLSLSLEDDSNEDTSPRTKKINSNSISPFSSISSSSPIAELFFSGAAPLPPLPAPNRNFFFQQPAAVNHPVPKPASALQQNNIFVSSAKISAEANNTIAPEEEKRKDMWGYF